MNSYIDRVRGSESLNLFLERRDQLAQRRVGRESHVRQHLVRDGRRVVRGQPFLDGSALVAVAVRAPAPPHIEPLTSQARVNISK